MQYQQINSSTPSSFFDPTYLPKELDSRLGEADADGESWKKLVETQKRKHSCGSNDVNSPG